MLQDNLVHLKRHAIFHNRDSPDLHLPLAQAQEPNLAAKHSNLHNPFRPDLQNLRVLRPIRQLLRFLQPRQRRYRPLVQILLHQTIHQVPFIPSRDFARVHLLQPQKQKQVNPRLNLIKNNQNTKIVKTDSILHFNLRLVSDVPLGPGARAFIQPLT